MKNSELNIIHVSKISIEKNGKVMLCDVKAAQMTKYLNIENANQFKFFVRARCFECEKSTKMLIVSFDYFRCG